MNPLLLVIDLCNAHAEERHMVDVVVSIGCFVASLVGLIWGLIAVHFGFDQKIPLTIMICAIIVSFVAYFIASKIFSDSFLKPILALVFLGGGSCLLYLLPAYNVWIFSWGNIFYIQMFFVIFVRGLLPD